MTITEKVNFINLHTFGAIEYKIKSEENCFSIVKVINALHHLETVFIGSENEVDEKLTQMMEEIF
ncbi:MAG: hypothetical protein GY793_08190 [Proteobacteria bacterium]|nr:hypothetical protein [Pseudomonadota bacterium]